MVLIKQILIQKLNGYIESLNEVERSAILDSYFPAVAGSLRVKSCKIEKDLENGLQTEDFFLINLFNAWKLVMVENL